MIISLYSNFITMCWNNFLLFSVRFFCLHSCCETAAVKRAMNKNQFHFFIKFSGRFLVPWRKSAMHEGQLETILSILLRDEGRWQIWRLSSHPGIDQKKINKRRFLTERRFKICMGYSGPALNESKTSYFFATIFDFK